MVRVRSSFILPPPLGVEVNDLTRGRKLPLSLRSEHQLREARRPIALARVAEHPELLSEGLRARSPVAWLPGASDRGQDAQDLLFGHGRIARGSGQAVCRSFGEARL